jgi:hypothetical protein
MPPADPICMRRALADADRPVRCDARLGLALQGPRAVSGLAESGIPRGGGIEESSESDSALREYHGQTLFVGLARARGRGS